MLSFKKSSTPAAAPKTIAEAPEPAPAPAPLEFLERAEGMLDNVLRLRQRQKEARARANILLRDRNQLLLRGQNPDPEIAALGAELENISARLPKTENEIRTIIRIGVPPLDAANLAEEARRYREKRDRLRAAVEQLIAAFEYAEGAAAAVSSAAPLISTVEVNARIRKIVDAIGESLPKMTAVGQMVLPAFEAKFIPRQGIQAALRAWRSQMQ